MTEPAPIPDLSVIIPTRNRAGSLGRLLHALRHQEPCDRQYEILVVDNGSTDETAAVARGAAKAAGAAPVRYLYEPRRGVSYARNLGAAHARADLLAFLDDDGIPNPEWIRSVWQAFADYPEADCIGGRLLPHWAAPPPSWMSPAHWGAVALQDRPAAMWLGRDSAASCLLTANFACRRDAFEQVGGFSPRFPRCQDREFELRLWAAGRRGLFLPSLDVIVDVPADRLTKRYHRRWQTTTGHYHAVMRYRDRVDAGGRLVPENPSSRYLLGTPLFLYRDALSHAIGWTRALVARDPATRFFHESRLYYLRSFFTTRCRSWLASANARPRRTTTPLRLRHGKLVDEDVEELSRRVNESSRSARAISHAGFTPLCPPPRSPGDPSTSSQRSATAGPMAP